MEPYEHQFAYHANAIAFGTRFSTPGAWESVGSVVLPTIGGRATASSAAYLLDGGFVTVRAVGSEVVGESTSADQDSATYTTRATTWVEGLRIGRYLEIEHLKVHLRSRYEWRRGDPSHEPDFLALTVEADGTRVCEQDWPARTTPELEWINGQPTFAAAKQAFMHSRGGGPRLVNSPQQRIYSAGPPGTALLAAVDEQQGIHEPDDLFVFGMEPPGDVDHRTVACPRMQCGQQGTSHQRVAGGFTLGFEHGHEPHGEVSFRFGEFVVTRGRRRFTAVRVTITRSPRSHLVIGELAINGSNHP